MHLRSREVLQSRAIRALRQQTHVHLQPAAQPEAHLVLPFGQQRVQRGIVRHVLHRRAHAVLRAGRPRGQNVQVAHRIPPPAQRPRRQNRREPLETPQILDQLLRGNLRVVQQKAPAALLVVLNALAQLLNELLAEARQPLQASGGDGLLQFLHRAHLQRVPQQRHRLRTHARQAQQLQHGGLVFQQQLFAQRHRARALDLLDIRRHPLADAGDLLQLLRVAGNRAQLDCGGFHRFGGAPVRADAKRIARADLQQVGRLRQQLRNRAIVHRRRLHHFLGRRNPEGGESRRCPQAGVRLGAKSPRPRGLSPTLVGKWCGSARPQATSRARIT